MNRTTFSILFFIKKSKLNKKQEAPIYLRITVNGERAETSIKRRIDPAKWNPSKGFIIWICSCCSYNHYGFSID